jgi:aminoglycoside phosphotransferase (APT) family kinase protein
VNAGAGIAPARVGTPDLSELISPEGALSLFRDAGVDVVAVDPEYVRLKPGAGAIVGYRLHGAGGRDGAASVPAYVRSLPDGRAALLAEKWRHMRPAETPFGAGVRILPGGGSILFVFPNDAALRGLRLVSDIEKLKRTLTKLDDRAIRGCRVRGSKSRLRPVRYKPERRFIAAADLSLKDDARSERREAKVFLRFFPDGRGERIRRTASHLREHAGGSLIPRPLGALLEGRLYVEESVEGPEIVRGVLEGDADPEAVADSLRRLHGAPPPTGSVRSLGEQLSRVAGGFRALAHLDRRLASTADSLIDRIARNRPDSHEPGPIHGPIHGDLHLHQILESPRGPVFVDFERAAVGDALEDLGNLVAHLLTLAEFDQPSRQNIHAFKDRLVDAYLRAAKGVRPADLDFFTACGLMERALLNFRRLDSEWRARAGSTLALAASVLEKRRLGSSPGPDRSPRFFTRAEPSPGEAKVWEVFYPRPGHDWPGFLENASGERTYGVYDSDTDGFRPVSPRDDPALGHAARWFELGDVVSYRVGRRATLRLHQNGHEGATSGSIEYAKVVPAKKVAAVVQRTAAAHAARTRAPQGFPSLAPLLEQIPEDGVLVFAGLPGVSLHELLMEDRPRLDQALTLTGHALSVFHSTPAAGLKLPVHKRPIDPETYARMVAEHFPGRAEEYRSALERLCRVPRPSGSGPPRLVHGDLHDRNILIAGRDIGLIDLDLLHAGDPVEDVGNLTGHLMLRALQRGSSVRTGRTLVRKFLRPYLDTGIEMDARAISAVGASTLFRLSCLYLFRRRWQHVTGPLLQEAVRWCGWAQGHAA